ncbi:MAG: cell division protein ZapE [Qingshengfaniella sp.]
MADLQKVYATQVLEGVIRPDPAQEAVLPDLERVRRDLNAPQPKRGFFSRKDKPAPVKGLYLWGGVGRGKSFLMDLFVAHAGIPKQRIHFHAFMQHVHAGMNAARKTGVDDAILPVADELIAKVRLLALDEMQITDITDAMIVGRLFERLFAAGVCVVTTSNRPPDDLYKDGLNRQLFLPFIEMIKTHMVVREMGAGLDHRQDRFGGEQMYFHPADAEARVAVDRLWTEMAGAPRESHGPVSTEMAANLARGLQLPHGEGLVLKVNGRDVVLPRFRNGVARVSFWDLCGQPLGPADYLAIADAIRVLILEDVPCMDLGKFNEAKRFVTLIDALYEAGVQLVVTAADEPERLYLEGAGSFEFERTASRLREMQSADWPPARSDPA